MMELVILLSLIVLIHLVVITKWQCGGMTLKCCSPKAPRSFQGAGHMLLRGCHCVPLALAGFIFKCLLLLFLFAPAHVWWLQEIWGRQSLHVLHLKMKWQVWGWTVSYSETLWHLVGWAEEAAARVLPLSKSALLCGNNGVPQDGKITPSPNSKLLQLSKNSKLLTRHKGCLLRKSFHTEKPDESISASAESPSLITEAGFQMWWVLVVFLPSALWLRSGCWATAWQGIA